MKNLLLILFSLLLLSSFACKSNFSTKVSKKEAENDVNYKEVITINGHKYMKTHSSYNMIKAYSYRKENSAKKIDFSYYSSNGKQTIEDINQDGKDDLVITSSPFLSQYTQHDVVLASKNGELDFKKKFHFDGYYKLEGKKFGVAKPIFDITECDNRPPPDIHRIVLYKWTDNGYKKEKNCYTNFPSKSECLCLPKKLKDCFSMEDLEKVKDKGSLLPIKGELKKAINYWL